MKLFYSASVSPRPGSSSKSSGYLSSMFTSSKNTDNNGQEMQNMGKGENENVDKIKVRKSPSASIGPDGPKSPTKTISARIPRKSSTEDESSPSRSPARSSPRKTSAVR